MWNIYYGHLKIKDLHLKIKVWVNRKFGRGGKLEGFIKDDTVGWGWWNAQSIWLAIEGDNKTYYKYTVNGLRLQTNIASAVLTFTVPV